MDAVEKKAAISPSKRAEIRQPTSKIDEIPRSKINSRAPSARDKNEKGGFDCGEDTYAADGRRTRFKTRVPRKRVGFVVKGVCLIFVS
jgi:hypothetical protein